MKYRLRTIRRNVTVHIQKRCLTLLTDSRRLSFCVFEKLSFYKTLSSNLNSGPASGHMRGSVGQLIGNPYTFARVRNRRFKDPVIPSQRR